MRTPRIPSGAEVVRTYADYEKHVAAFFQGVYHLLIVVGAPGLAKSHSFETRLGDTSHLIRGWTAPLQAYIEAYWHRNKLLIFDDAEVLWKRPGGRVLLRSLCEFKPKKRLQWLSTTRELEKAQVPQSFLTSSRVAIVANRFLFGDSEEQEAILDRAHVIHFDPWPMEVHTKVADWFFCQEIYDYIGDRLHLLTKTSARLYVKAWERKKAGGDWRRLIEETFCHDSTMRVVQALEVDASCLTVEDRVKKFTELTGACRATYFNLKKELKQADQINAFERAEMPKRQLHRQPPVELNIEEEVARAKDEDLRAGSDQPDGVQEPPHAEEADKPAWCHFSGDPADYSTCSGYVEDWWNRSEAHGTGDDTQTSAPKNPESDDTDGIALLRRELTEAINREDHVRAAEFRDEIQRREGQSRTD